MEKPVFGVYEWAKYSTNCVLGCKNNCKYCFSKSSAIKSGKKTKDSWIEEEIIEKAINKKYYKRQGTCMFPSHHDITPNNLNYCLIVLEKILNAGNNVLIVSKPHLLCVEAICKKFFNHKDNILFRFTIGSADDTILKYWEPNAPCFMERAFSLAFAHTLGFKTSVSCEPMLDNNIYRVVELVIPYVTDAIWLGKMNFAEDRLRTNGEIESINEVKKLMELQDDNFILDLYNVYKDEPKIKWKDSIKEIVGLERFTESGLDR